MTRKRKQQGVDGTNKQVMELVGQYRIIIAGSREFDNYNLLKEKCDYYLSSLMKLFEIIIVSGHASGADALGERYAKERGLQTELYPADWTAHGKAAGPIRNAEMAQNADIMIAFWDGKSRGTKNMIDVAKKRGLNVRVIEYQNLQEVSK